MVHDKLENLIKYIPQNQQKVVEKFLKKVSNGMPEGKYDIDGENVYARIMSYPTKLESECEIEAHNVYCDIQFTLLGTEGISIYKRELLQEKSEDIANDFMTFETLDASRHAAVSNLPGYFTLIFPQEAHRPQESWDKKCAVVKKGVIKIKEELFNV